MGNEGHHRQDVKLVIEDERDYEDGDNLREARGVFAALGISAFIAVAIWIALSGGTMEVCNQASSLGLNAGDDCPKCGGELERVIHRFDSSGGPPDCYWLFCSDCGFKTDPE